MDGCVDPRCFCSSCISSHFPLWGNRAITSFKNVNPCITLKRTLQQDVGLNYKGCHFQTRFTQSRGVLMIDQLCPKHTLSHTHSLFKWKISLWAQVCFFVEFHLRLNSLLTAMNRFPVFVSHHCKRKSNTSVSQYQTFWGWTKSSKFLTSGKDILCLGPTTNNILRTVNMRLSESLRSSAHTEKCSRSLLPTVQLVDVSQCCLTCSSMHYLSNAIWFDWYIMLSQSDSNIFTQLLIKVKSKVIQ